MAWQRNGPPACHHLIKSRLELLQYLNNFRTLLRFFQMPSANLDRRPSADTRVGILPTKAPGLSRRDGAKVVEMFGGRGNLPEVERPATSAATDFRLNHKPRKKTKEDNELRKLFAEASSHAPIPPRAHSGHCARPGHRPAICHTPQQAAVLCSLIPTVMAASTRSR